ncbi:DNA polymerase III subunit alpha [Pseudofulvimonas gallinarii]|jgi:DNA polymerase-3 subunit alpha|uniref:DNA polymerase III subunit alpha n=1 Tax=Pseudofulvimonas gallinarii TaxID=634155 RepID=A0A4R3LQ20_9GAMM|nr:DNA polymerase III alpha subunit [Pseudofulvimonas gallinarii]THD13596.1 DNA polymerase III subunit alpha [Pseudofulvimonas gallinarii]
MPARFVHLNTHSEYSLVDSTIRMPGKPQLGLPAKAGDRPNLVSRCVELGMPALALADQDNLFGLVKFYRACQTAGVQPIAGCDLRIGARREHEAPTRASVLCRNGNGYRSLSHLLTRAWMEAPRQDNRPLLPPQWLAEHAQELFLLLGSQSDVAAALAAGRDSEAERLLQRWQQHFGDRLYLTLSRTGRAHEAAWEPAALALAHRLGLPVVAQNDVRFLDREDYEAHEARVCIATGRVLGDPKRPREYSPEQYMKSPAQMAELFADLPEALDNTVELARRCTLELQLGTYFLPAFPVPEQETLDSWIRQEAERGLERRLARQALAPGRSREDYAARLHREVDVIVQMGFPGYFLIVADFINWAKNNGIPVGPGRGSGAGSLVAWSLGITDLDPLPYDLLFERFLNPERVSMPDFDIDFCMDRRDEVIDYVARKYGRDQVSQIITYGTMAAKAVVRDCGRVLGHPYGFVDGVAKLIPMTLGVTLEDALGRSDKARADSELSSPELIQRYNDEDEVRDLLDLALKLESLARNAGKHAGGVVIAPKPLSEFCPMYAEAGGLNPVTQFDKDDVESVGLVKFDFLGLRTLTIIDWAVKSINERLLLGGGSPVDLSTLPLDDRASYELFARADTVAVFQFESTGMRRMLKDAKPDRFEDLIALVSLYRPGPMDLIPDFIERKHGRQRVEYLDPRMEPILGPTYGIMVYQEQVMQIAQALGGYTLGGADLLRRAMGKKQPEEMAKQREIFREGAAKNGIAQAVADAVFDQMEKFAGYGFNKSHAAAYALVAYHTAWLKAHYPADFMAAVLSSDMDKTDKLVGFIGEAQAMRLAIEPPHVNRCDYMFKALDARRIAYGLGAIRGVGENAVHAIIEARARGGDFRDLADLCRRVDSGKLNRRVLETLIQSGACDGLGGNRATLMAQLPEAMRLAEQDHANAAAGQHDMFGMFQADSVLGTATLNVPAQPEWPLRQKLAAERDTLGWYLSGHPTSEYRPLLEQLVGVPLERAESLLQGSGDSRGDNGRSEYSRGVTVVLAGMVVDVRQRGASQGFVSIEDWSGRVEASFYAEGWLDNAPRLSRERIVLVEGQLRPDNFNGGGVSLRGRGVLDLDEALARFAESLHLTIDAERCDFPSLAAELRAALPGRCSLRLHLRTGSARGDLVPALDWRLRPSLDLLDRLRTRTGIVELDLRLRRASALSTGNTPPPDTRDHDEALALRYTAEA